MSLQGIAPETIGIKHLSVNAPLHLLCQSEEPTNVLLSAFCFELLNFRLFAAHHYVQPHAFLILSVEGAVSQEHAGYETAALMPPVSSAIGQVANSYSVPEEELLHGQRGTRNEARQVAMYLIRELSNRSLKHIAETFSLGSYSGIGAACSVIDRHIKVDRKLRRRIEEIRGMAISTSIQKQTSFLSMLFLVQSKASSIFKSLVLYSASYTPSPPLSDNSLST